ncbi:hypothetical protein [Vibrio gallaecicus]|uniref:hypothetical protein n=1 Tax=Vibrio gallaecicus TaxID=552386 RepID=UPI0025B291B4|nr:hypothetical protein [Vibrio gallaecicus]MDN3614823.1 hypothetical protein [Vibrio gallaecicus]
MGYPRVDGFETSAKDVWTYSVRNHVNKEDYSVEFYFDMKPFRDTSSLLRDVDNHCKSYNPDLIILQVGIVDCYPRALKRMELQVLSRVPYINKLTKKIVNYYYKDLVKRRDIAYVSIGDYRNNLSELKSKFSGSQWLVIPIAPTSNEYKKKNPLIEERVNLYNLVQKEVFGNDYKDDVYIECCLDKLFLEDNHHLSRYGHSVVSRKIIEYLKDFNTSDYLK